MAQITDLYIYPVKSLKGITLARAKTAHRGLEYDREWMITDNTYHFISQREIELMTTIETQIDSRFLILNSSNKRVLKVPLDSKRSKTVRAINFFGGRLRVRLRYFLFLFIFLITHG